ncbi:PREDICTED: enolase-phosphatase E1-like [Priapulus caudatus]|uniref:Enolase-phosphatase E1 n=1 Tax=Priapulus caudatus TaxID=37621 RepID=A0ABM1E4I7_PRICU|nr:PREDICTED: enolase-phosphatase E1-like [Priapulus caudatus]
MAGEKRRTCVENDISAGTRVLLLDIEGTTSSISFVKDHMFSYIKENVEQYLKTHWNEEECRCDVEELRQLADTDLEEKVEGAVKIPLLEDELEETVRKAVVANVLWQMSLDRKTTALKQHQGHMWRAAFKTGILKGHIYDDVVPVLEAWKEKGCSVYIYSSGSVDAQKLLFGYSEKGDLLHLFAGHFDTKVGMKMETESYRNIAKECECKPEEMIFLTDVVKEAQAAKQAGMKVALVERPGNAPLTQEDRADFDVIQSFKNIGVEVQHPCNNEAGNSEAKVARLSESGDTDHSIANILNKE